MEKEHRLSYRDWGKALHLDCEPEQIFKPEHPIRQALPILDDAGIRLIEKDKKINLNFGTGKLFLLYNLVFLILGGIALIALFSGENEQAKKIFDSNLGAFLIYILPVVGFILLLKSSISRSFVFDVNTGDVCQVVKVLAFKLLKTRTACQKIELIEPTMQKKVFGNRLLLSLQVKEAKPLQLECRDRLEFQVLLIAALRFQFLVTGDLKLKN
jgi:hypothetical protein